MNALAILIAVGCLGLLLYVVGAQHIRDVLDDFWAREDRRAHIREMEAREGLERLRSRSAYFEAMALQAQEIDELPTFDEPRPWAA